MTEFKRMFAAATKNAITSIGDVTEFNPMMFSGEFPIGTHSPIRFAKTGEAIVLVTDVESEGLVAVGKQYGAILPMTAFGKMIGDAINLSEIDGDLEAAIRAGTDEIYTSLLAEAPVIDPELAKLAKLASLLTQKASHAMTVAYEVQGDGVFIHNFSEIFATQPPGMAIDHNAAGDPYLLLDIALMQESKAGLKMLDAAGIDIATLMDEGFDRTAENTVDHWLSPTISDELMVKAVEVALCYSDIKPPQGVTTKSLALAALAQIDDSADARFEDGDPVTGIGGNAGAVVTGEKQPDAMAAG